MGSDTSTLITYLPEAQQEQFYICLLVTPRFIRRYYIIIYRAFTMFHHSSSIHYPSPDDLNYQAHAMR